MTPATYSSADLSGWTLPTLSDEEFTLFRDLIRRLAGIHLSDGRRQLLVSRLARKMRDLGMPTFADYHRWLITHAPVDEVRAMINLITTNKTSFFREPHHFDFLQSRVIPELRRAGRRRLRIWSAGCSTGEEPYSIAIAVVKAIQGEPGWDVRILASDIDTEVLARAQAGIYPVDSLAELPQTLVRAWFLKGYGAFDGMAHVRPQLQPMIDFRRINLNNEQWKVQTSFDVIFCRNVIIYFNRELQERIVRQLSAHLNPDGYFFCGHSENLSGLADTLVMLQPTVYQLKPEGSPA